MGFSNFITTVAGREMLAEALTGGRLTLTKIQLGDGEITSQAPQALTALIHPTLDVAIASKEVKQGAAKDGSVANYALIRGHFRASELENSFYFREIGVFAKIGDGAESLFAYNNAYALVDYVDKDAKETQERTLVIPVFIGQMQEVSAEINVDLTYVSVEEFQDHRDDATVHVPSGGKAGQFLQRTAAGTAWADVFIPPTFDNLLAWPGCKRITPPKSGSTWTERIVTKDGGLLRAQRVTVIASEGDITETYTFYEEDGATVAAKYIVHSTKDGAETWTEDVTKEEIT